MAEVDSLSIKITSDVTNASNAIDQLIAKLTTLKGSMNGIGNAFKGVSTASSGATKGVNLFANTATAASKKSFSLASAIGKVYASYWLLFRAFGKLKNAVNLSSDLVETQNVVDVTFGDMRDKVQELADVSITQLGMSELSVKKFASRFQAMGVTMGITNEQVSDATQLIMKLNSQLEKTGYNTAANSMADMSIQLTRLVADYSSLYNMDQADVAKKFEAIFTGMTRPMREFGIDLTQASLQEFALANGIEKKVKEMTNAEKTLLRYEYVMANSTRAMGDFIRTSNNWANQVRILQQLLQKLGATIGTVFINLLKPVVRNVNIMLNSLIAMVTKGVNALGKLLGWQIEITDVGVAEDMEDFAEAAEEADEGLGGAADNAKKLKGQLQGFDKLNVLNTKDGSGKGKGSGSGAGAGIGGGGATGGDFSLIPTTKPYESDVKSWFDLGKRLRDAIVGGLKSIDWDEIQLNAMRWGNRIGEVLSALVTPDENGIYQLGMQIGHTLAQALNTAVDFFYNLGQTLDARKFFTNLGKSIATAVNTFFTEFDFAEFADTIDVWVQGIWTTITTALMGDAEGGGIDWGLIFSKAFEFLTHLDPSTYAILFGVFLWKVLSGGLASILVLIRTGLGNAIGTEISAGIMASPAMQAITEKGLFGAIASAIGGISTAVKVATGAIGVLVTGLAIAYAKSEDVREKFHEAASALRDSLAPAIDFVSNTVIPDMKRGWEGLLGVIKPLTDFIGGVFVSIWNDMISPALKNIAENVVPKVIQTMKDLWEKVLVPLAQFIGSVFTPVFSFVATLFQSFWQNIVVPFAQFVGTYFYSVFENIYVLFDKILIPVLGVVISVFQFLWEKVLSPLADFVGGVFLTVFTTAFEGIGKVVSGIQTIFADLIEFIDAVFSKDWSRAWETVKNLFKDMFNIIIDVAEWAINKVIDGINWFFTWGIGKLAKDALGHFDINIGEIDHVSLPRFANGGFPEDGLFLANHNELIGGFNGQTAVANNEQITDGIYRAVSDALRENGGGETVVEIDGREVFRAVKKENQRQINRTGYGLA